MIGQKHIEINWKNFVQGMTTSNVTEDGGFSIGVGNGVDSVATHSIVNPYTNPGKLAFAALPIDKSTNATGEIVASCEDVTGDHARLAVSSDDAQHGQCYSVDGEGTLTTRGDEDTTHGVYQEGRTDITSFDGEFYFTSGSYLRQWALPATFDGGAGYPFGFSDIYAYHPVLVYEDTLYIGDGNILLEVTGAGVTPTAVLTMAANYTIQALGIDPASGKMLISTQDQYDHTNRYNVQGRVHYYNGYSNTVAKIVLTNEPITAFYNMGGTVFVAYGENFGYWTGTGTQFLRRFNLNTPFYKHSMTNIMDVLYIAAGKRIIAFGEIMQGQGRSWWYPFQNSLPSGSLNTVRFVVRLLNDIIAFSCGTSKFYTLDTSSTSNIDSDTGNTTWYSKEHNFPKAVTFNSVTIQYDANVTASTDIGTLYLIDDTGTEYTLGTVNTAETKLSFDFPYLTVETRSFQLKYIAKNNTPIERITIFYTPKE